MTYTNDKNDYQTHKHTHTHVVLFVGGVTLRPLASRYTTWCFCAPLQWLPLSPACNRMPSSIRRTYHLVIGQVPSLQQMHHLQPLTDDFNIANIHKYPDTQCMVYLPTFVCMANVGIPYGIYQTKNTHHLFIEVWKSKFKESPKFPASRLSGSPLTKMRPMRLAKFMAETMTTALVTKKTGGNLGNKNPQHQFLLEDFGRLRKECVFKTSILSFHIIPVDRTEMPEMEFIWFTHSIHGTDVVTYIYHITINHSGRYNHTSPMDVIG